MRRQVQLVTMALSLAAAGSAYSAVVQYRATVAWWDAHSGEELQDYNNVLVTVNYQANGSFAMSLYDYKHFPHSGIPWWSFTDSLIGAMDGTIAGTQAVGPLNYERILVSESGSYRNEEHTLVWGDAVCSTIEMGKFGVGDALRFQSHGYKREYNVGGTVYDSYVSSNIGLVYFLEEYPVPDPATLSLFIAGGSMITRRRRAVHA